MHVDEAGHTPLGQLLIEGTGFIEHVVHVGDAGHIPRRQFIIERIGIRKHVVHVDGWCCPLAVGFGAQHDRFWDEGLFTITPGI